jgi:hypothetical protein
MIRWTPKSFSSPPQRWQPQEAILRAHLDSLSPDELRQVRPSYYWLRFGRKAWALHQTRKANFNPDQPRDDQGRWAENGNEWSQSQRDGNFNLAARTSRQREAECEAQYKLDSAICRMVQTQLCWQQAMKRRAACISGYPLPPLNF